MTSHSRTPYWPQLETETAESLFDNWFDPIEAGLRDRARDFLQEMLEAELDEVLARSRYARRAKRSSADSEKPVGVTGHRHGHRSRSLLGTFGQMKIEMPRARLNTRPAEHSRGQDDRVEEPDPARLPAPHAGCRRADRRLLPCWHQHAPGTAGAGCSVRGRGRQGHGEPGLAQGEERLGRVEDPVAGR
jgi:hypothetical protein